MHIQMLGLCRFSYVGMHGYQKVHQSIEERRAFLYNPDRLARRWLWFTQIALPAWLDQTDPDFTLVIMTGPDLPEFYLSQLRRLTDRVPQLQLAVVPPMKWHLRACRVAIAPYVNQDADVIGHFRHDDDDAVAVDYIESARQDFQNVKGMWEAERKLSLDYSRGLILQISKDGATVTPRICHNATAALTVFLDPEVHESAVNYDHSKIAQWMPGVSVTRPLMFVRSVHEDADSGHAGPGIPWKLEDDDLPELLWDRFRLRENELQRTIREFASVNPN